LEKLFDKHGAVRLSGNGRADHRCDDHRRAQAAHQCGREADIKEGRVPDEWQDKPAKLRQKDRDARWTVKISSSRMP
jgi:hypothetical protein